MAQLTRHNCTCPNVKGSIHMRSCRLYYCNQFQSSAFVILTLIFLTYKDILLLFVEITKLQALQSQFAYNVCRDEVCSLWFSSLFIHPIWDTKKACIYIADSAFPDISIRRQNPSSTNLLSVYKSKQKYAFQRHYPKGDYYT